MTVLMLLQDMEDRLIELEAMQKVLLEGSGLLPFKSWIQNIIYSLLPEQKDKNRNTIFLAEAYDKLETGLILAKQRLTKILQSKDKKATVSDGTATLLLGVCLC